MDEDQAAREIEMLRREIRSLHMTMERQNSAAEQFSRRVEELARQTEAMEQSRIWRALVAVGGWMLAVAKLFPARARLAKHVEARRADAAYRRWIRECEEHGETGSAHPAAITVLTNGRGLADAASEYVTLLNAGDALAPGALAEVAALVRRSGPIDIIYSDEDEMDGGGERSAPFFKPDWSPDLLLSTNYVGRMLVLRTEAARAAGGFDAQMGAAAEYDLLLRMMANGASAGHIPKVLYHGGGARRDTRLEQQALEGFLRRTAPGAYVQPGAAPDTFRVRYPIRPEARVSIVIPSGGNADALERNLNAIARLTDYANYELAIIDNSRANAIQQLCASHLARYIDWRWKPFNFSEICNHAARQCESPLLLFLNDDTEPLTAGWLRALVELAMRSEVGAVGGKLLFPDGTIQHAGVVLGLFGRSGHAFKHLRGDARHYHDLPDTIRNVSAVTGACLMTRASVFREVGGFDEVNFPVDSNDIDLCLRIQKAGYRVLYTPFALLRHDEAVSKRPADLHAHPAEVAAFAERWRVAIDADPFYNPNLTRDEEDFSPRLKT